MAKNYIIVNTKGGVGKTSIATQIIPCLFQGASKINILELDNNNISNLSNTNLNIRTFKINDDANSAINKVYFNVLTQRDVVNIIDVGGGDDTKNVLSYIHKIIARGFTYIVPINNDISQIKNALETIKIIKKIDENAPIFLILNRCKSLSSQAIKEQFIGVFGSEKWGIKGKLAEIEAIPELHIEAVEDSTLYTVLSSIYGQTLSDFYPGALDLVENIDEYRVKWAGESDDEAEFDAKMQQFTLAQDMVDLHKKLNLVLADLKN